jgi:hypothetical protein
VTCDVWRSITIVREAPSQSHRQPRRCEGGDVTVVVYRPMSRFPLFLIRFSHAGRLRPLVAHETRPPWFCPKRFGRRLAFFLDLGRAIATLNSADTPPSPELLRYLSPLSWEHINLTGNYTWPRATHKPGTYRPLRRSPNR